MYLCFDWWSVWVWVWVCVGGGGHSSSCTPTATHLVAQAQFSLSLSLPLQTPMVDLQLHHDGGAYAFSGDILTLEDVERCVFDEVLPHRPVETWLSPRFGVVGFWGAGGMLANVIHSSRLVGFAEAKMLADGKVRQRALLQLRKTDDKRSD